MRDADGRLAALAALAALYDPARGPDALARLGEPGAGEAAVRVRHLARLPRRDRLAALAAALADPAPPESAVAVAVASERPRAAAALRRPETIRGRSLRRVLRERLACARPDAGAPPPAGPRTRSRPASLKSPVFAGPLRWHRR